MKAQIHTLETVCNAIEKAIHEMNIETKDHQENAWEMVKSYARMTGTIEAIIANARLQLVTNKKGKK